MGLYFITGGTGLLIHNSLTISAARAQAATNVAPPNREAMSTAVCTSATLDGPIGPCTGGSGARRGRLGCLLQGFSVGVPDAGTSEYHWLPMVRGLTNWGHRRFTH